MRLVLGGRGRLGGCEGGWEALRLVLGGRGRLGGCEGGWEALGGWSWAVKLGGEAGRCG